MSMHETKPQFMQFLATNAIDPDEYILHEKHVFMWHLIMPTKNLY